MLKTIFLSMFSFLMLLKASLSSYALPCVEVHGFIRLDAQYQDRIPIYFPSQPFPDAFTIPLNNQPRNKHGQTLVDTRLTRCNLSAWYDFCKVSILGFIEVDFLSESTFSLDPRLRPDAGTQRNVFLVNGDARFANSFIPRLRHAFIYFDTDYGWNLMVGQFWTQFVSMELADPQLLDFVGPAGYTVVRQPQIALGYCAPLGCDFGQLRFVASIEKQAVSRLDLERLVHLHPAFQDENQGYLQQYPLFVARAGWYDYDPLQVEVAGAGTQIRFEENANFVDFPLYQKDGWAAQATVQSTWNCLTFFARYRYLDGLNRLSGTEFPDVVIATPPGGTPHLETIRSHGGFAGVTWEPSPCTSITAIYGQTNAKEVPFSTFSSGLVTRFGVADAVKRVRSYQLAAIHWVLPTLSVGVEFKRWQATTFGNVGGHLDVYAFATSYHF